MLDISGCDRGGLQRAEIGRRCKRRVRQLRSPALARVLVPEPVPLLAAPVAVARHAAAAALLQLVLAAVLVTVRASAIAAMTAKRVESKRWKQR